MTVFKCKMCGGHLTLQEGSTVCECEFCGTLQTVPMADDEKKMNLFSRANRLRFSNEFDKAAGVYENIVSDYPEEAEAYWGLVLCKYGIEYVDDPATGRKIPTCHRSSFESVFEDSNFDLVMENADPISKRVYREEAKQIEELRKGIIEVSSKEEPYDIFICYKETDEDGGRTLDSVLAQDIYDALTDKGYKVFFSRVTLEDKLGVEYEPYIFAALHSAKIMLAVGTQYEYYDAVWVKNEWSRFLKLMAAGEKKTLIPVFKNLDAYDMPKEFARLQAQDMGKVGAMQDLLRGIEKIIGKKDVRDPEKGKSETDESPLVRRAEIYLEKKDWDKTLEYCERILDINPENSQAYLMKEMAEKKCGSLDELIVLYYSESLPEGEALSYARRFADEKTRKVLSGFDNRIENVNVILQSDSRHNDSCAQLIRSKLKGIRDRAEFLESRVFSADDVTYLIKEDGSIEGTRYLNGEPKESYKITCWQKVKSIEKVKIQSGRFKGPSLDIIGVQYDGSISMIRAIKDESEYSSDYIDYSEVKKWNDISKIYSNWNGLTYGITSNGTVLCSGNNRFADIEKERYGSVSDDVSYLTNISEFCGRFLGRPIFLKNDGTLAFTEFTGDTDNTYWNEISQWTHIKKVFLLKDRLIGLKTDGTLITTSFIGNEKNEVEWGNVMKWRDVVDIYQDGSRVIALDEYGVLHSEHLSNGEPDFEAWKEISKWKNIAKINYSFGIVYAITLDEMLLVSKYTGEKRYFQKWMGEVNKTTGVSGFKEFARYCVIIKNDGTLIAKGQNDHGECDVYNLKLCEDIDSFQSNVENNIKREVLKKKEEIYEKASRALVRAVSGNDYLNVISLLEKITGYKDVDDMLIACKQSGQEAIYTSSISKMNNTDNIKELTKCAAALNYIRGYKDAEQLAKKCKDKIHSIKEKKEAAKDIYLQYESYCDFISKTNEQKRSINQIEEKISQISKELCELEQRIPLVRSYFNKITALNIDIERNEEDIHKLLQKKSTLGFFSGKEKKAIDAQVNSISSEQEKMRKELIDYKQLISPYEYFGEAEAGIEHERQTLLNKQRMLNNQKNELSAEIAQSTTIDEDKLYDQLLDKTVLQVLLKDPEKSHLLLEDHKIKRFISHNQFDENYDDYSSMSADELCEIEKWDLWNLPSSKIDKDKLDKRSETELIDDIESYLKSADLLDNYSIEREVPAYRFDADKVIKKYYGDLGYTNDNEPFSVNKYGRPATFVINDFQGNTRLIIMVVAKETSVTHQLVKWCQLWCKDNNVPYLRLYLGAPNTEHYVVRKVYEKMKHHKNK